MSKLEKTKVLGKCKVCKGKVTLKTYSSLKRVVKCGPTEYGLSADAKPAPEKKIQTTTCSCDGCGIIYDESFFKK